MRSCLCLSYVMKCYVLGCCRSWVIIPQGIRMHCLFQYQVLQLRWHPKLNHLLFILYNDNYIRLMNTQKRTMVRMFSFGRHPENNMSTVIPLGENAIDFDFFPHLTKVYFVELVFFNSLFQGCWKLPWRESSKTTFESKQVIM